MATPTEYVDGYLAERAGQPADLARAVTTSSGLDANGILAALGDKRVGPQVIEMMADLMHPTDSMYFDAIYGAHHGQAAIRGWLVPTMDEISFIEFVPQAETLMFDDGLGGTSVDQWQMVAVMDGERIPLPLGVSVRRYQDGWVTWNADVYDTSPMRQPPDPNSDMEALPPWPRTEWPIEATDSAVHQALPITQQSAAADVVALLHADCVWIHPMLGRLEGADVVGAALTVIEAKGGNMRYDSIGPRLFNGSASVEEWQQAAVQPDGSAVAIARGTTVRQYADGKIVSITDYFDTASLADAELQAAAHAAGSTLTEADIAQFQTG